MNNGSLFIRHVVRIFEFVFVGKFLVCVSVCFPCLLIHVYWYLSTARLKISTSPHWHFFYSLFFSRDNTEVGLTRLFHGQCAPTKKDSNYSPLGYYTPYGKRFSDVSEENVPSILRVKHLPEPKFHPEDEDSMIPKTSEQTIQ